MNNLKNNADKLLYDFGLLNELKNYGTPYIVGSYAMDLMAWNDLDIYVSNESMSTEKLYKLTSFILNQFQPVWYEAKQDIVDGKKVWFHGFETNITGELWNIDIWFFDEKTISKANDFIKGIKRRITFNPDLKDIVIDIKNNLIEHKLYEFDKYTSIDVYKAVFEDKICSYNEFLKAYGEKYYA